MPKGNNYPTLPTAAEVAQLQQALGQLEAALAAVPNFGPDVLTSASLSPERLPLADKAAEVAAAAPAVMRRSHDAARLPAKLAAYRQLVALRNALGRADQKLANALNVLGADMVFDIGNIHEDVEKDNGETVDLGPLRTELHEYYRHPGATAKAKAKKAAAAPGT